MAHSKSQKQQLADDGGEKIFKEHLRFATPAILSTEVVACATPPPELAQSGFEE
jgi:hypothetical protein